NKDGACSFCGATITDGRWDWVLADVQPFTPDLAFRAASTPAPAPVHREHVDPFERDGDAELSLAILAKVMFADGEMSPQERDALVRLGSHRSLTEGQVQLVIDSAQTTQAVVPTPKNPRQAVQHLEQLVHAVLADGQISRRERKLLSRYAEKVDLSVADVKMAISKERRSAYARARRQIKAGRSSQTTLG
ncbi:MAG: TerB family tellurite resistance protein, partial [Planctomycetota bacterium]